MRSDVAALLLDGRDSKRTASDGSGSTPLLLTPTQAAQALAISPRKLWSMTTGGELPHVRMGRCVRYPLDDLRRWIEAQQEGGR
jgi:excisionase family DNA binding protein